MKICISCGERNWRRPGAPLYHCASCHTLLPAGTLGAPCGSPIAAPGCDDGMLPAGCYQTATAWSDDA